MTIAVSKEMQGNSYLQCSLEIFTSLALIFFFSLIRQITQEDLSEFDQPFHSTKNDVIDSAFNLPSEKLCM